MRTSHDYIKLPRLQQLSKTLSSRIPLEKGRTSANNIMNFISNMTKHTIMAKPYKMPSVTEGTEANPNPFPVEVQGMQQHNRDNRLIIRQKGSLFMLLIFWDTLQIIRIVFMIFWPVKHINIQTIKEF